MIELPFNPSYIVIGTTTLHSHVPGSTAISGGLVHYFSGGKMNKFDNTSPVNAHPVCCENAV